MQKSRKFFVTSGILFCVLAVLSFIFDVLIYGSIRILFQPETFKNLTLPVLLFFVGYLMLGISMLIKNGSVMRIAASGVVCVYYTYILVNNIMHLRYANLYYLLLNMIVNFLNLLSFVLLMVFAILAIKKRPHGMLKAWFVPMILSIWGVLSLFVPIILYGDRYYSISPVALLCRVLLVLGCTFAGYAFYCCGFENMQKRPTPIMPQFVPIQPQFYGATVPQNVNTYQNTQNTNNTGRNVADPVNELRRYKELLDDGVITEEEFNDKKKQLLK